MYCDFRESFNEGHLGLHGLATQVDGVCRDWIQAEDLHVLSVTIGCL